MLPTPTTARLVAITPFPLFVDDVIARSSLSSVCRGRILIGPSSLLPSLQRLYIHAAVDRSEPGYGGGNTHTQKRAGEREGGNTLLVSCCCITPPAVCVCAKRAKEPGSIRSLQLIHPVAPLHRRRGVPPSSFHAGHMHLMPCFQSSTKKKQKEEEEMLSHSYRRTERRRAKETLKET